MLLTRLSNKIVQKGLVIKHSEMAKLLKLLNFQLVLQKLVITYNEAH